MAKPKQERNTKENKKLQIGLVILIMKRGSHVGWTQIISVIEENSSHVLECSRFSQFFIS